jgi:hypothetical protein
MSKKYNDDMSADEQLAAEKAIASYLFDNFDMHTEANAAEAGRVILRTVLESFRPDLFIHNTRTKK